MGKLKIISFVLLALLVSNSCLDDEVYPIIPEIQFEDFVLLKNTTTGLYDRGVLKFSFKDGDGDIGLKQADTAAPYDFNLFINLFEIINTDTVEFIPVYYNPVTQQYDTLSFNQRIPVLTPTTAQKAIKGTIEDTLDIYNYATNEPFDTIFYTVYIKDRQLHQSNTIFTPLILPNP